MSGCCNDKSCALEALQARQRSSLIVVLIINATMFIVIAVAAFFADSSALLADSLDNLGDAMTYALSLYVITRSTTAKARVALFKGLLILLSALFVAGQIVWRIIVETTPVFELMGAFSLLGLVANTASLLILWRHRHEDVNMSSVWECSRNDIATNISVFLAAGGVWLTGSAWPDILVATLLVAMLLRSSARVIGEALTEIRRAGDEQDR